MRTRFFLLLLAGSAVALSAEEGKFEKSMPVPHGGDVKIGWSRGGCGIPSLTVRNFPSREDIDTARREKPDDKSWVWWDFHVENRGSIKCKISLWVDIFDKGGRAVKSSDRTDTVDAGRLDDNIRVSTRMRTLDIADSPRVTIRAQIGPK
ncbi:MAG TPA: hypothetical protein VJ776_11040 [Thermoanaerobaculia bacterium]|nr:hypothetical protein [Thermoanaerobaculia bacterium]